MKTLIVIQARIGSSRLPNKVMLPLAGRPLLQRQIERVLSAHGEFEIIVATTTRLEDERVVELCRTMGVKCFRGHETDLLDRHYRAALHEKADVVVKIPSDCPLIEPNAVSRVLSAFQERTARYDYISNLHPPSYPDGNDVELMTMPALETAWLEAARPFEREHTTPFLWERPERFRIGNVLWEKHLDYSLRYRFTIDYAEDYHFISAVYHQLWTETAPIFSMESILSLMHYRPDIAAINAHLNGVNWYRHYLLELKSITSDRTRQYFETAVP